MMGVTKAIQAGFLSVSDNFYVIMILIFILLFFVGMFVQTTPGNRYLQPDSASDCYQLWYGSDSVWFGYDFIPGNRVCNTRR